MQMPMRNARTNFHVTVELTHGNVLHNNVCTYGLPQHAFFVLGGERAHIQYTHPPTLCRNLMIK